MTFSTIQKSGFDPKYRALHYDGKGRVADWMKAQTSVVSNDGMSWSCVTTGPYMDTLKIVRPATSVMTSSLTSGKFLWGPLIRRADGTFVFAAPIDKGHVPFISLRDVGWFARYTFDHRAETSGQDLEVASEMVGLDQMASTFTKVTGQKAAVVRLSVEDWFKNFNNTDLPLVRGRQLGSGSVTWKQNFSAFFNIFRDDIVKRDMEWVHKVYPHHHTLESWMREYGYDGGLDASGKTLKDAEDGNITVSTDLEHIAATLGHA